MLAETVKIRVAAPRAATKPAELRALTGLRFFAAFGVLLYHFGQNASYFTNHTGNISTFVHGLMSSGWAAVPFFFVLSGFILAYVYTRKPTINKRAFWVARVARIYPIYVVALALAFLPEAIWRAQPLLAEHPVEMIAASLALLQAWIPQPLLWIDGPSWSLSVEAFFYLLFPLLIGPLVMKLNRLGAVTLAILSVAVAWVAVIIYLQHFPDGAILGTPPDGAPSRVPWVVMAYNPLVHLPTFVLGAAIGRFYLLERRPMPLAWLQSIVAAVTLIVVLANWSHWPWMLLNDAALLPLYAWLILALAAEQGPLAWALSLPPIVVLGEASYGLYLIHIPIFETFIRYLPPSQPFFSIHVLAGYMALCVLVSVVFYFVIESPARRMIRKLA